MTDQINSITRQWVAIKYSDEDERTYTFHNDGPPVAIGDRVEIAGKNAPKKVIVAGLPTEPPPFETKPILGLAPPPAVKAEDVDQAQPE